MLERVNLVGEKGSMLMNLEEEVKMVGEKVNLVGEKRNLVGEKGNLLGE